MPMGILDKAQSIATTGFGFGETAIVRYRGQVWQAGMSGSLTTIGFNRALPSKDIKVYIDTVDANNFPAHAIGSELYSFIIPVAQITGGYQEFDLPTPLAGIVAGTKYCFYLAPFTGGAYSDDYRDVQGNNATTGGVTEITNTNGVWATENLAFNYAIYITENSIDLLQAENGVSISAENTIPILPQGTKGIRFYTQMDAGGVSIKTVIGNFEFQDSLITGIDGAVPLGGDVTKWKETVCTYDATTGYTSRDIGKTYNSSTDKFA